MLQPGRSRSYSETGTTPWTRRISTTSRSRSTTCFVDGGPGEDTLTGRPCGLVRRRPHPRRAETAATRSTAALDTTRSREAPGATSSTAWAETTRSTAAPGSTPFAATTATTRSAGGFDHDEYSGGAGNDRLVNSYNDDQFVGGTGVDTVDYTGWESCLGSPCDPDGVVVTFDGNANDGNWDLDCRARRFRCRPTTSGSMSRGSSARPSSTQLNGGAMSTDPPDLHRPRWERHDHRRTGDDRHDRRVRQRQLHADGVDPHRPGDGHAVGHRGRLAERRSRRQHASTPRPSLGP